MHGLCRGDEWDAGERGGAKETAPIDCSVAVLTRNTHPVAEEDGEAVIQRRVREETEVSRARMQEEELKAFLRDYCMRTETSWLKNDGLPVSWPISLDVGWCEIGADGCMMLARALEGNITLQKLDVSDNEIGPAGCAALASALAGN